MKRHTRLSAVATIAIAAMLSIAGLVGCGGGSGASVTKADAVVVTYYYLPL